MTRISREEFGHRLVRLQDEMRRRGVDACFVYGDEYRRENLRYIANVWPIFERAAAIVPASGNLFVIGAPEGEMLIKEMSAWPDLRLVPDFTCVTVPDEIEYPQANYTTFEKIFKDVGERGSFRNLGIVGLDAIPAPLIEKIIKAAGVDIIDANDIFFALRLNKSKEEVECIMKAVEIADKAYTEMMRFARPGVTELQMAGVATGEAMKLGAEFVPFCLVSSGERVNTIIGRATNKVVEDGDMVMAALAVQYEGYISTFNFPFVVGKMSGQQRQLIDWLIGAYEKAIVKLKAGSRQGDLVAAVKGHFAESGISEYDLYPPMHGCGLAEAESPYPNEHTDSLFTANMTVNTDISVYGHPYGSNRIETSFLVTEEGYYSPSRLFKILIDAWKDGKNYTEVI